MPQSPLPDPGPDRTSENIETILAFHAREDQKITRAQRVIERISRYLAEPAYLALLLLLVALWMVANLILEVTGRPAFDPAPYFWLQGIVGLGALLTATIVLSKQERYAGMAEQREHLDLKVTLLTEHKVAKLIALLEELRHDLPNVKDREDPGAAAMKQPINPAEVLAALGERGGLEERARVSVESEAKIETTAPGPEIRR